MVTDRVPVERTLLACVCGTWQVDYVNDLDPAVAVEFMADLETILGEHGSTCVPFRLRLLAPDPTAQPEPAAMSMYAATCDETPEPERTPGLDRLRSAARDLLKAPRSPETPKSPKAP